MEYEWYTAVLQTFERTTKEGMVMTILLTLPENLAAGKNTLQSSTCCGGLSARAVDGDADTQFKNGHCSHTEENPNPSWWRVDLGSNNVSVSEVRIVNRFSQYSSIQQRSQDYKITLGKRCHHSKMLIV